MPPAQCKPCRTPPRGRSSRSLRATSEETPSRSFRVVDETTPGTQTQNGERLYQNLSAIRFIDRCIERPAKMGTTKCKGFVKTDFLSSLFREQRPRSLTPAHLAQERKHLLSRLVVRQAEIVVKRAVVLAGSAMSFYRHVRCSEHLSKSLRLRLGLRVIGVHNVEDQERRNVLALGNVHDR